MQQPDFVQSLKDTTAIINALPGCYLLLLPDAPLFTIAGASDSYLEATYLNREQTIGKPLFETLPDDQHNPSASGVTNLSASLEHVLAHKKQHRMPDQRYDVWNPAKGQFEMRVWQPLNKPVLDKTGAVQFIIHWVEDITEKVQLEEKAQEYRAAIQLSERHMRKAMTIETVGILYFDLDGALLDANAAFARMSGYSIADLQNGHVRWDEITAPEFREATLKSKEEFINRGENTPYEKQYIRPDGSRWWGLFAGKRLSRTRCVEFVLDITEAKQREQALIEKDATFRNMVEHARVALSIFRGPSFIIESANKNMFQFWGKPGEAVLNRPLFEAIPEARSQGYEELLNRVLVTGTSLSAQEQAVTLPRKGRLETVLINFSFEPIRDPDGTLNRIMAMVTDVTGQVRSRQHIEESQQQLLALFEQSPIAIGVIRRENLRFQMVNPFFASLVDRRSADMVGKPFLEALPELSGQGFENLLQQVIDTGAPFLAPEVPVTLRRGQGLETIFVNLAYQPIVENQGVVNGVFIIATDVTFQVRARERVAASEARFRSIIEEAPVATCVFTGPDMKIEVANQMMIAVWGKGPGVMGLPLAEALPELKGQHFLPLLDELYRTGESYESKGGRADLVIEGELKTFYFDYTFKPLQDETGKVYAIMEMAVDQTAQVTAQRKLAESELFARRIIDNAPVAEVVFTGRDMHISVINQQMLAMLGCDERVIGLPFHEAMPDLENTPLLERLQQVFDTGETYYHPEERIELVKNGTLTTGFYNYIYKALRNAAGEIYGIINTATDVTDQVLARQRVEEAEANMHGAIELAQLGTWIIDLATGKITYSPRLQEWLGLEESAIRPEGSLAIDEADRERIAHALEKVIREEGKTGFDETYTIRNLKTGQKRIVHTVGKYLMGTSGQPGSVSGTAQDVTMQKQLQFTLEHEVRIRTEELAAAVQQLRETNNELEQLNTQLMRSNEELSQYAYVASHDLQEPLRKIRMFTSLAQKDLSISSPVAAHIQKIDGSAQRMSMLINDLLSYSRVIGSQGMMELVDLNKVAYEVTQDYELVIGEKGAVIRIGSLPAIESVSLHMNQLFANLLGNALKFNKPGVPPVIELTSAPVEEDEVRRYIPNPFSFARYYRITVSDNGIGFDTQYSEQIFEVFKRLHNKVTYPGSGIGLALCRRIVLNHHGFLYAESTKEAGSAFHLFLPDRQHPENGTR